MQEKTWFRTNEFRFVERRKTLPTFDAMINGETMKKILQQKFELRSVDDKFQFETPIEIEWRDVPVVSE